MTKFYPAMEKKHVSLNNPGSFLARWSQETVKIWVSQKPDFLQKRQIKGCVCVCVAFLRWGLVMYARVAFNSLYNSSKPHAHRNPPASAFQELGEMHALPYQVLFLFSVFRIELRGSHAWYLLYHQDIALSFELFLKVNCTWLAEKIKTTNIIKYERCSRRLLMFINVPLI